MIPTREVSRIVIPVPAGVGNAIMTMPLVRQLHAGLLAANGRPPEICVIAYGSAIADVFRSMPEAGEVRVTGPGRRGFFRFVRWARQRRADLYLIPYPSNRWQYSVFAATCGARRVLLHRYPVGYWRAMHWVPATRVEAVAGIHDVQQNLRLLTALGIEPGMDDAPRMAISPEHESAAEGLLRSAGLGADEKFVIVHPGSGDTGWGLFKRWSPGNFGRICTVLPDLTDCRVVVVEGPDEAGIAQSVIDLTLAERSTDRTHTFRSPIALRLSGPLGVSAAVLRRASRYVGSDSAVAHLAGAVGTPTVTLYAPTDPITCRPLGSHNVPVVLRKSCAPCFTYPLQTPYPAVKCARRRCIDEISVEDVLAAVERSMSATDGARGAGTA